MLSLDLSDHCGRVTVVGSILLLGNRKPPRSEEETEGRPELPRHGAVDHEVDGRVDECKQVHHLAEVLVAVGEELLPILNGEENKYPLRELGDKKKQEDCEEHPGGSVRLSVFLCYSRSFSAPTSQCFTPPLGLHKC